MIGTEQPPQNNNINFHIHAPAIEYNEPLNAIVIVPKSGLMLMQLVLKLKMQGSLNAVGFNF